MNRYVHFVRLIESLKRNSWAKYTDVYVALDYPPTEKYREGYEQICEYLLEDFEEFKSITIIKREENYGSLRNLRELRDMILEKYDRFIRTDDDAEFSPNFLEYMNKCLNKYENDPNIIAVTGYSYPIKWKVSEGATVFKENFSCPMWGTGFWRDKYIQITNYIENGGLKDSVEYVIKNRIYNNMLDRCKYEYINLCLGNEFSGSLANKVSDVSFRMYSVVYNKYIIVPNESKVRNWGFDGSGCICKSIDSSKKGDLSSTYLYNEQAIDKKESFVLLEDTNVCVEENRILLNLFDRISIKDKIKTTIKILLYKFIGRKNYEKLLKVLI